MLVQNIALYQSVDIKSRIMAAKPVKNIVSKTASTDTYEASGANGQGRPPPSAIREDLINTVKKRIGSGFYNSKDVLEDLSNSFAKALNQTIL
jgi:hypothetical protein